MLVPCTVLEGRHVLGQVEHLVEFKNGLIFGHGSVP